VLTQGAGTRPGHCPAAKSSQTCESLSDQIKDMPGNIKEMNESSSTDINTQNLYEIQVFPPYYETKESILDFIRFWIHWVMLIYYENTY
jgi:hypothetical protein